MITVDMDEPESHITQQTPPPSPYLETTWDLPLEELHDGLLHPKEKRRGYLELYFAGFMEFADSPPSPAMSDDETEYPQWGKVNATRDGSRPSTAMADVPQSPETSTFSDAAESIIHPLSRRTATASTDSTEFSGYESSQRDLPPSTLLEKTSSTRIQKRKREFTRRVSPGSGRVTKAYRRSYSTIRTQSKAVNSQPRLRSHSTSSARKHANSKGR